MNYSKNVEIAIKNSRIFALEYFSNTIRPEHLFLAMIDDKNSVTYRIFYEEKLNIKKKKKTIKTKNKKSRRGQSTRSVRCKKQE